MRFDDYEPNEHTIEFTKDGIYIDYSYGTPRWVYMYSYCSDTKAITYKTPWRMVSLQVIELTNKSLTLQLDKDFRVGFKKNKR